jgi:DNA repair exonuclease SbcCD ATPase subunit
VVIEHPARAGWKLTEGEDPVESSASYHRFRITVEPKKTTTLVVKEYRPLTNRYLISNITDNEIKLFLEQKMINPEMERALRKVIVQKDGIAALEAEVGSRKSQITEISADQQRLRENMKALKGSAEEKALVERYVRQMNQQEDRVQQLQHEMADLQQKRNAAQKTLNETIEGLQMDVTL